MKRAKAKVFIVLLICFSTICRAQNTDSVLIHTENCNELIAGIDNYISMIAVQDTFLSLEQISASLITPYGFLYEKPPIPLAIEYQYGKFKIRPDSIGSVEFQFKIGENTLTKKVRVKPMEAVCKLSMHGANSEKKIPVREFQAQQGLVAYVECCGFDARCQVMEFEIIRIDTNNHASRAENERARFEDASLQLIHKAQSGDLYIFRNIYYRCPGGENQRSDDMIFEIK